MPLKTYNMVESVIRRYLTEVNNGLFTSSVILYPEKKRPFSFAGGASFGLIKNCYGVGVVVGDDLNPGVSDLEGNLVAFIIPEGEHVGAIFPFPDDVVLTAVSHDDGIAPVPNLNFH